MLYPNNFEPRQCRNCMNLEVYKGDPDVGEPEAVFCQAMTHLVSSLPEGAEDLEDFAEQVEIGIVSCYQALAGLDQCPAFAQVPKRKPRSRLQGSILDLKA